MLMVTLQLILNDMGIKAMVVDKVNGCRTTTYDIRFHQSSKTLPTKNQIQMIGVRLGAENIRLVQVPERNCFAFEVSAKEPELVKIKDIIQSSEFVNKNAKLKFIVGQTPTGEKVVSDLVSAKHLLVGGTTGSGKSVFLNTLLMSLLAHESPDNMRLLLIDPKRIELCGYNGIPHLLSPVICEPSEAMSALEWVNVEMERRYKCMEAISKSCGSPLRDIDKCNEYIDFLIEKTDSKETPENRIKNRELRMPHIVVVIDELAQLLMSQPTETWKSNGSTTTRKSNKTLENSIIKIAQLGRAAGIHLVVATQRPSVDIITPLIRENLPTKIAFAVPRRGSSEVILGVGGAQDLLGKGDMLFKLENDMQPRRVQGAYVSDGDVGRILNNIRENNSPPIFDKNLMNMLNGNGYGGMNSDYVFSEPIEREVRQVLGRDDEREADEFHELYVLDQITSDIGI